MLKITWNWKKKHTNNPKVSKSTNMLYDHIPLDYDVSMNTASSPNFFVILTKRTYSTNNKKLV
jgi:hypothetical protein